MDESTTIITLELGQQVSRINQLVDVVKEELASGGAVVWVRAAQ